ncbi:scavenger receptor cysteine-rich type 1 protein M130-like [Rhinoraja longicauda]
MVGPEEPCVGDLEIHYKGRWMSVCTTHWNESYGEIVCRQTRCHLYDTRLTQPISPKHGPLLLNKVQCNGTDISSSGCSFTVSNAEDCESGEIVSIFCKVTSRLVLADGASPCAGRVEASSALPLFFIICGRAYGMNEAQRTCNYIGCGDAVSASGNSQFGVGKWSMLQFAIHCNDTEGDPWKCKRKALAHPNCSVETEAAGIVCSEHREPRLIGGSDRCHGRLEIVHGATWGTVCDWHWDMQNARVLCRTLKCGQVISVIGVAYFGEGSGAVWQESYACQGNETSLWNCASVQRRQHTCTHERDVSVICSGQKGPRLVGGKDRCSGTVEILRGESWGTVCDTYWDLQDAAVVCNHLRCGVALSAPGGAFFGEGNGSIWKDIHECRGNEMRLNDCPISSRGHRPCTHKNDAGVICSVEYWQLRLADGVGVCDGRVEVYYGGVWGRVTDSQWDLRDADVVCRQLNCGSVINVYNYSKHATGRGPVLLDNVTCNGSERYLWNCTFEQPNNLSMGDDVGVLCSDQLPTRLIDGGSRCAGRIEIYYNSTWGTVCDDSWDLMDGHVVCKELNCGYALNVTVSGWFGQGSGPIWMDNVNCSANNSALWQCPARAMGENDCSHKEDAGVICSDHKAIRLANGANPCQGRVEVFFNGTWGTVCADFFGKRNAGVVCAQLGCGSTPLVPHSTEFGRGSGPVWLDEVKCRLHDSLLWQCPSSPWGQNDCNHGDDVGVICSDVQLVTGLDRCSGRVEVYFGGTWGTVCDDSWDMLDAAVVCGQLNCGDPVLASARELFPQGRRKPRYPDPTVPIYEEIDPGTGLVDSQFISSVYSDLLEREDEDFTRVDARFDDDFGNEYDDIE